MPTPPVTVDDTVIYNLRNFFADKNIVVRMLDSSTLEIWGAVYVNGSLIVDTALGIAIASQAEAIAGIDNTKVMTPLRVRQASNALYLPLAGGTITGELFLNENVYFLAGSQVEFNSTVSFYDPVSIANPGGAALLVEGGTAYFDGDVTFNTQTFADKMFVTDPITSLQQVATKAYVDSVSSAISDGDKGDIIVSGSGTVWLVDATQVVKTTGDQLSIMGQKRFLEYVYLDGGASVDDTSQLTIWGTLRTMVGSSSIFDGPAYFNGIVEVPEEAYGIAWDDNYTVPIKKDIYDKIQTMVAGTVPDGNKGDITVSGTGSSWQLNADSVGQNEISAGAIGSSEIDLLAVTTAKIANDAVDNTKLANMAQSAIKGRVSVGLGDPEDLNATQVKTILSLENVTNTSDAGKPVSTAQQTALDLKADVSTTVTLAGAQTITGLKSFTQNVTVPATTYGPTWDNNNTAPTKDAIYDKIESLGTVADDSITNAKLNNMVQNTIKGRVTGSTGDPEDLTPANARTIIASDSGGGTANFLRADGTWAAPPSGGASNTATFSYNTTTTEPPIGNQLRLNSTTFSAATRLWVAQVTVDGLDVGIGLARIVTGHQIYFQDRDDASKWVKYTVTSDGVDDGSYYDFGVVYHSGPGAIPAGQVELQGIAPGTVGVPPGGTSGQALTKSSSTDYAVGWSSVVANGGGVSIIQALTQAAYNALSPPVATTLYVIVP